MMNNVGKDGGSPSKDRRGKTGTGSAVDALIKMNMKEKHASCETTKGNSRAWPSAALAGLTLSLT